MRIKALLLTVVGLALFAAPALAEEIVHFTNGTEMAVVSHSIEDDMIYVDLGGDAEMAFPLEQVEKIVEADSGFVLPKNSRGNRIVTPNSRPVTGTVPSRYGRERDDATMARQSDVSTDANGVAVHRPYAGDNHAGKRKIGVAGSERVFGAPPTRERTEGSPTGTSRVGARHRIMPGNVGTATKPAPVGVKPRTTPKPTKK